MNMSAESPSVLFRLQFLMIWLLVSAGRGGEGQWGL